MVNKVDCEPKIGKASPRKDVLKAVTANGCQLKHAGWKMKLDEEVVRAAVTTYGLALCEVQPAEEEQRRALWAEGEKYALGNVAISSPRDQLDIVQLALKNDKAALACVPEILRGFSKKIWEAAAVATPPLATLLPLLGDSEIPPAVGPSITETSRSRSSIAGETRLSEIPAALRKTRDPSSIAETRLKYDLAETSRTPRNSEWNVKDGTYLPGKGLKAREAEWAKWEREKDCEQAKIGTGSPRLAVLKAVGANGCHLKYASQERKSDEEVVRAAVTTYGLALCETPEERPSLRYRPDIVQLALKNDAAAFKCVPSEQGYFTKVRYFTKVLEAKKNMREGIREAPARLGEGLKKGG